MKVTGQVVRLKEPFAFVRASRPESCEHCANSAGCTKRQVDICAYNDVGAEKGDFVTVETNDDRSVAPIFAYLFLVPLAILFLCYYLYTLLPWLALAAIPLLGAYWFGLRRINASHPVRARIVGPASGPTECGDLKIKEENEETT